jgi:hypothetical protein
MYSRFLKAVADLKKHLPRRKHGLVVYIISLGLDECAFAVLIPYIQRISYLLQFSLRIAIFFAVDCFFAAGHNSKLPNHR